MYKEESFNSHEARLRNCKKIYDQLHHSNLRTYIIKKKHLEHIEANVSTNKSKEKFMQVDRIHNYNSEGKSHGSKSPASINLLRKKQNKQKRSESPTDIVKRMKEIDFSNKKKDHEHLQVIKRLLAASDKRKNSNEFLASKEKLSKSGDRIFDSSQKHWEMFKNNGNRRRSRIQTHAGHIDEKPRSFSIAETNKKSQSFEKYLNSQKVNPLQNPTFAIRRTKKSSPSRQKSSLKNRSQLEDLRNQNIESITPLLISCKKNPASWLDSYLTFICCPEENREFYIHLNFESIRKMSIEQAWDKLDIRNLKLIEGMMKGIRQSVQNYEEGTSETKIKELITLYFNNHEKIRMQLILKEHYFKLFAFKLKPIFVYQRLILYFIHISIKHLMPVQGEHHEWVKQKIKGTANQLKSIYSLITEIISETGGRNSKGKGINQTFKILRNVGEVERKIQYLEKEIKEWVKFVNENEEQVRSKFIDIPEIHKTLSPFIHEDAMYRQRSYQNFIKMEMLLSWKLLRVPPTPFLPAKKPQFKHTIILDLDETIIYFSQEDNMLRYRPNLDNFFKFLKSMNFQIILFSASSKLYADTIAKQIETKERIFQFRLYKEHLTLYKGRLIKDIRRLGRDLSKTIILDDIATNFMSCPENGIEVRSWTGDKCDCQLMKLIPILKQIVDAGDAGDGAGDMREEIKNHSKQLQQILEEGEFDEFSSQLSENQFISQSENRIIQEYGISRNDYYSKKKQY